MWDSFISDAHAAYPKVPLAFVCALASLSRAARSRNAPFLARLHNTHRSGRSRQQVVSLCFFACALSQCASQSVVCAVHGAGAAVAAGSLQNSASAARYRVCVVLWAQMKRVSASLLQKAWKDAGCFHFDVDPGDR